MLTFYDIIGTNENSSVEDIKKAYFNYLRKIHPDKGQAECDPTAVTQATLIWNTLKDCKRRKEYDYWLIEQRLREQKGTVSEQIEIDRDITELEEYCRCVWFLLSLFGSKEDFGRMSSSTKIVILGESEVGKTSFVNAVAGKPGQGFPSTIGVSICMAWHEYRAGTAEQRSELMELWDIGGTLAHRSASQVLLDGAAGAILVHDLSNKKSEENLGQWMSLLDGKPRPAGSTRSITADIESSHIPILIVGCKSDLAPLRGPIAYDRVNVDCRKQIPPGSSTSMALARFFDATIDRTKAPSNERRRRIGNQFQ
ncbi:unnamed protein product [Auanema sp. JU1783]|nr:unnamed protein product [Auanema sp. JU1783]